MENGNLHAPTVASGPTSGPATTNGAAGHLSFAELQEKKENTEAELRALGSVLDTHGVDMDTPLLTRDGFPRSDIDVAQVRTTRARIIRLRNDYKDLMKTIENHLHNHFANLDDDAAPQAPISNGHIGLPDAEDDAPDPVFARVNTVAAGSPAETAGLKPSDEIRNFGYVNWSNHDGLKRLGECVQGNEGANIFIRVSRPTGAAQRQELRLTLYPRKDWGGRGMLGCHILPIQ